MVVERNEMMMVQGICRRVEKFPGVGKDKKLHKKGGRLRGFGHVERMDKTVG